MSVRGLDRSCQCATSQRLLAISGSVMFAAGLLYLGLLRVFENHLVAQWLLAIIAVIGWLTGLNRTIRLAGAIALTSVAAVVSVALVLHGEGFSSALVCQIGLLIATSICVWRWRDASLVASKKAWFVVGLEALVVVAMVFATLFPVIPQ